MSESSAPSTSVGTKRPFSYSPRMSGSLLLTNAASDARPRAAIGISPCAAHPAVAGPLFGWRGTPPPPCELTGPDLPDGGGDPSGDRGADGPNSFACSAARASAAASSGAEIVGASSPFHASGGRDGCVVIFIPGGSGVPSGSVRANLSFICINGAAAIGFACAAGCGASRSVSEPTGSGAAFGTVGDDGAGAYGAATCPPSGCPADADPRRCTVRGCCDCC